jgi:hypothetical protein
LKFKHLTSNAAISHRDRVALGGFLSQMEERLHAATAVATELRLLREEHEALQNANKGLVLANFDLEQQKIASSQGLADLLAVTETLRQARAKAEQMAALAHPATSPGITRGLGSVPPEVMRIWGQMSQFCKDILDGQLLELDFAPYFPSDLSTKPARPAFNMDRPVFTDDTPRFTVFFNEIKRNWDEKGLFASLETQIRLLFEAVSSRYVKQMSAFEAEQTGITGEAIRKLDELRSSAPDPSEVLSVVLAQSEVLRIPRKGLPAADVHDSIRSV